MADSKTTLKATPEAPELAYIEMSPGDAVQSKVEEAMTPEERAEEARIERRLLWKLDLLILPVLATAYFLASMGRSDLANAKVAGMTADLDLSAQQYSNIANMFIVGYIVFQIPGTVLVRKVGPPFQFACAMIGWGVFTAVLVKAGSYADLMGLRFLVGVAEAFLAGMVFYMSFWYKYTELVTRGAIYFSTSALAGSFNGLIAYGIQQNLDGVNGWRPWQWLYLIEGVIPIGFAFISLIMLPSTPERGHFLFTKAEREVAIRRSLKTHNPVDAKLRPHLIYKPLVEVRFWLLTAMYAFNHFALTSLSNFLPAIINGFGYTAVRAQLMSVIVYACAMVGVISFGVVADRINKRGIPLIVATAVSVLGYILLLTITNYKGRLAATCILCFGLYATIPLNTTWVTVNIAGYTKRGSATAMFNMFAQAFSMAGNQAYIDPPLYRKGNVAAMSVMIAHGLTAVVLLWVIKRENDKKAKLRAELPPEELARLRAESLDIVGDRHIDFVYGY